jgi:hypothetical protein
MQTGLSFSEKTRGHSIALAVPGKVYRNTVIISAIMKYRIMAILLIIALTTILATGCITPPVSNNTTGDGGPGGGKLNITACTQDSDCVPAQCCHPTSCINKTYKEVCTVLCTQSCEGPIDCGAGHCGCVNGTCGVRPGLGTT